MQNKLITLLLFSLLISCTPSEKMDVLLKQTPAQAKSQYFKNELSINNKDGHLQGIQLYQHKKENYYILSGSSDSLSYYLIADINQGQVISVNKFLESPFRHAGGFQIADKLLAVGIEDNIEKDKSKVLLYEIKDPKKSDLKLLKTIERAGEIKRYTSGCVALTKHKKNILIAVGNWDSKNIDFYSISNKDLKNTNKNFQLIDSLDSEKINRETWIEKSWFPYQNINFLSDSKQNLYLAGTAFIDSTKIELVDIFSVSITENKKVKLQKVAHRKFNKPEGSTFRWGGGVYFDKRNRLHLLSTGKHARDTLKVNLY